MRPLILLIIPLLIFACKKKNNGTRQCQVPCATLPFHPAFGPRSDDSKYDTIVVRTYAPPDSFTTPLTERYYFSMDVGNGSDTIYNAYPGLSLAADLTNYEIEVPGTGDIYRLWNMFAYERHEIENCPEGGNYVAKCFNDMQGNYTRNGLEAGEPEEIKLGNKKYLVLQ